MLEECSRIFFRNLRKRLPNRPDESFPHPCPRFPEQILDLGESLLDEPTTVRLYTPVSSSGHKIIASLRFDPLPMSMVSAG